MQQPALVTIMLGLLGMNLVSAAPSAPVTARDVQFATIALSNDQTGAYGSAQIPINGITILINGAYPGTGIQQGGLYTANSASLVGGLAYNPICTIEQTVGNSLGQLTSQKTYLKLGDPNMLSEIQLNNGAISCTYA